MKTEAELNAMTVMQLRDYATEQEIDLAGSTYKADIIAAIMLAEEGESEPEVAPEPEPVSEPEGESTVTEETSTRQMPEPAPLVSDEAGTTAQLLANQREDVAEESGESHAQALDEIARKQEARKAGLPAPTPADEDDDE